MSSCRATNAKAHSATFTLRNIAYATRDEWTLQHGGEAITNYATRVAEGLDEVIGKATTDTERHDG